MMAFLGVLADNERNGEGYVNVTVTESDHQVSEAAEHGGGTVQTSLFVFEIMSRTVQLIKI